MTNIKHPPSEPKRAGVWISLRHGVYLILEKMLRWCVNPRLRARLLRLLGARIGNNVRIYEIQLFNLESGFGNLLVANDVHIGPGCRLDLAGPVSIGERSTLSPGVTILSHSDPGHSHCSKLAELYPAHTDGAFIGADCWLGANTITLPGVRVNDLTVVAAGSVVTAEFPLGSVVAGVPAKLKKAIVLPPELTVKVIGHRDDISSHISR